MKLRLPPLCLGAGMLLIGLLLNVGFAAWNYLAVTLMLLAAVPGGSYRSTAKPIRSAEPSGRLAAGVLAAAMLLSAIFSVWVGLRQPLLMSQERTALTGTTTLQKQGDYAVISPDWVWSGTMTVQLTGTPGTVVSLSAGEAAAQITLDETGFALYELAVPTLQPKATLLYVSGGGAELTSWHAVSRIHWPKLLVFLSSLWGTEAALYCLWKKRIGYAAFWLSLGLSVCMLTGRVVTMPHGWDEAVHRTLTMQLCGTGLTGFADFVGRFTVWYIGYLPAALGTGLGLLLKLPIQLTYRIGWLTAAMGYAALVGLAVHLTPRYKLSMLALACVPTCAFIAGSYTYDGVVIGCALLFCALLLRAAEKKAPLSTGERMALLLPFTLAALTKPVYALLLPLVFLLPKACFADRRDQTVFRLYALLLTAWCFLCLLLPGAYDNVVAGDARFNGTSVSGQLAFLAAHPVDFLRLMGGYLLRQMPINYVDAPLYVLGSLNGIRKLGRLLSVMLLLFCPLASRSEDLSRPSGLTAKRRIVLFALSLLPVLLLTFTQYCVSTPVGADFVQGMQERYTLPVWLLFAAALMLPLPLRQKAVRFTPVIEVLTVLALAVSCVYTVYWIVLPIWWY